MLDRKLLLSIASALFLANSNVYAEDCSFLKLDPLTLADRQVYFEPVSGEPWQLLSQPINSSSMQKEARLAYVFREAFRQGRSGVIVIKSGRNRSFTEPQIGLRDKRVALVRAAGNYCRGESSFEGSVTAKSYDDYHDLGIGGSDIAAFRRFHAGYLGRNKYCRQTDENLVDAESSRTNRGQFSYDNRIVMGGTYNQFGNAFGVTPASASSDRYEDQRVEIRQYETKPGVPVCVRISLPAQKKPVSFVRINDLEALTFNQTRYVRSSETEWFLTPQ